MNSPVLKLQEMASSSTTDIAELLSRAKMISIKLGLQDISEWIEHELSGYPSNDVLPSYRILKNAPIQAFNPYVGWIPVQLSNNKRLYEEFYDSMTTLYIGNSISMLIEFSKGGSDLYSDLPNFMSTFLQNATHCKFRMAWYVNQAQITNILSSVRFKILDWALLLENKNILGEGLKFSPDEKKEALGMTINNTNIFHGNVNNGGTIGAGNTGDIHQKNTVIAGDFSSLEQQLKDYGIDDSDIADLRRIIDVSSKPVSKDNFGEKIGGWIGTIIGKAYSGGLKIAATAAPVLLTNALCHYYGIPV
ncbi:TPA: abortive phage resistance protein [Providencia alcalifaciens]